MTLIKALLLNKPGRKKIVVKSIVSSRKTCFLLACCLLSQVPQLAAQKSPKQPVDYVDNFIGVRDINSSCVLGPQLPNASINPSPHTAPGKVNYDMDGYVMGNPVRGFGQLHVSGTGWGKYGKLTRMPYFLSTNIRC